MGWGTFISLFKKNNTNPLAEKYLKMYQEAVINPEKISETKWYANKLEAGKLRYERVAAKFGMPYWFIGCIHILESGGKFSTHLHNGDSLKARTTHVPKGRPIEGNPPFTWEQSAEDALRYQKLDKVADWSIGNCLVELEKYNGTGYRSKKINSPYLFSYTQFYTKGKYVADGKFDPNAISKQPGCVAIMKALKV